MDKIGYSKKSTRMENGSKPKGENPRNIHVAAAFQYETEREARNAERNTHRNFNHLKHQKEWFRIAWTEVAQWLESTGAKLCAEE
ncbi:MAG: GIY-YIG nuclease family protein [Gammaproteobacteria bacterium]|nr:GIY-YIG nuclease family protein [Gammaproteobacteria bacterium]